MSRLRVFVVLSLLIHVAILGLLGRVSLRVPETEGSVPVRVRLVSSGESNVQERKSNVKERDEMPPKREGQKEKTPKNEKKPENPEAAKPENREDAAAMEMMPGENEKKVLHQKDSMESAEPVQPQEPVVPKAETEGDKREKRNLSEKGKTAPDAGQTPDQDAVQEHRESEIKEGGEEQDSQNGEKKAAEKEKSDDAAESDEGGQNRSFSTPPVITEEMVAKKVMPVYPLVARRRGEEGRVLLRVTLEDSGTVKKILVEESSGFDDLDKVALQAVARWLFSPEAPSTVLVPVTFRLQ
ncbi:MAG: TonB family protein [Thermovirgaceae bacterium]